MSAYFFILLYLMAMVRPILPVADYIINKNYISEFLCINQEKPELQCDGKCYLMQVLEEQEARKKENLPRIAMEEYPIGFVELYHIQEKMIPQSERRQPLGYSNRYEWLGSQNCFHPPKHCA